MFKKIWFWLENSRVFTLPMSIFSWLVSCPQSANDIKLPTPRGIIDKPLKKASYPINDCRN